MLEGQEIIYLDLSNLEKLLLEYYKDEFNADDLKIESKIVPDVFSSKTIEFKLIYRKEISLNTNIHKEYILEQKDIRTALNNLLASDNYKLCNFYYQFCEHSDNVKNIKLIVQKRKENKLKKVLTRNKKGGK